MSQVTKWKRFVGDTDDIVLQLSGLDEILGGAAVSAVVIRDGVSTALPASVTDAVNFIITIPCTTWLSTAAVGTYELRVVLDDVTWPERGRCEVVVAATP